MKKTPIQFLQQRKERLLVSLKQGRESDLLHKHTEILDDYFRESFAQSTVGPGMHMEKNPCAFLALGGYGRREQCIHSDVDILLLFKKKIPEGAKDLIQEIFYPLWDIKLEVGYSTRSLKECIKLAGEDFEVFTSLADARFLCGFSPLYSELVQAMEEKILRKNARSFIQWLVEESRKRHERYGDSTYLLEPNIKEGLGGLRDYHAIRWMVWAKYRILSLEELLQKEHLTQAEHQEFREALSFIWKTRNRLHHLSGRKCDQLYFEYQVDLAKALKYKDGQGMQAVERFLGDMHGHMEFVKQLHMLFIDKVTPRKPYWNKRRKLSRLRTRGLKPLDGTLSFESVETLERNPHLLIKIFEQSAQLQAPLSFEAKRAVREHLHLVTPEFRTSQPVINSLRKVMVAPTPAFSALREMFNTGLFPALIPEMKGIINRIQYDEYHLYPVDKHLLRTIQIVKGFGEPGQDLGNRLAEQLYREIPDPEPLVWAALLHDIGKGVPEEDHSKQGAEIAVKVLERMSFPEPYRIQIAFLIREHLSLIKTATQRDIQDEKTIVQFARKFKDLDALKRLYLLTLADARATGPKAWNDWIDILLKELFFKVFHMIRKGELASAESSKTVERKKRELFKTVIGASREELENLFEQMAPRYLLYTPVKDMLRHIEMVQRLEQAPVVLDSRQNGETDFRTVTVCAKDRPGLFSKISGVFTLNNLNILDANIYTWGNNTALDIFMVVAPTDRLLEEETWNRVKRDLHAALAGDLELEEALHQKMSSYKTTPRKTPSRPDEIVVDNGGSDFFTIIEVYTSDFPGLLYKITHALFQLNLDVRIAKIATRVDQVVDIFFVRDLDGQKVDDPEQVAIIKDAIGKLLGKSAQVPMDSTPVKPC